MSEQDLESRMTVVESDVHSIKGDVGELKTAFASLKDQFSASHETLTKIEGNQRIGIKVGAFIGGAIVVALIGGVVAAMLTIFASGFRHWVQDSASPPPVQQQQQQSLVVPDDPPSQRAYLTPDDVAEREQVNADTVRRWIAEGRIVPSPEQGRERGPWAIDPAYSVVPESRTDQARSVHAAP